MAVNLHDGRFDCPDRLFLSMKGAWHSCNNSMTDVKELIPELFYDASVLLNSNNLPLGTQPTPGQEKGEVVNDVRLPPWAKGDAHEFIRLHRLALESEYVSAHLHEWVDLVFGAKQVGESAVRASNLFYYLTYEGAVDLALIEDPVLREATTAQIKHFGQTPSQLMTQPHLPRDPADSCLMTSPPRSASCRRRTCARSPTSARTHGRLPSNRRKLCRCSRRLAMKSQEAMRRGPTDYTMKDRSRWRCFGRARKSAWPWSPTTSRSSSSRGATCRPPSLAPASRERRPPVWSWWRRRWHDAVRALYAEAGAWSDVGGAAAALPRTAHFGQRALRLAKRHHEGNLGVAVRRLPRR